jgi:hypothetical protein
LRYHYRDTDRSATVAYAIAEVVNAGSFVLAGKPQVVIGAIYFNMFFYYRAESFAHFVKNGLAASGAQQAVAEVGMHATAVPVEGAQGFAMPVDGNAVFFANALKQVAGQPNLVAGFLGTFCKNLKLPLTCGYFGINTFYIQASFEAYVQVLFNDFAAECIVSAYRTVVRTLRTGETIGRKTKWLAGLRIPQKILLLKSKPEIIVVIVYMCTAIGIVPSAFNTSHITTKAFLRCGSGIIYTGFNRQSLLPPKACSVLEPSKLQLEQSSSLPLKSFSILVLLLRLCVGWHPSSHTYSSFEIDIICYS